MQRFVTVAVVGAMLGVVGTVAAVRAFQPTDKPAPVVQIAPAAQTVTPSPTTTTATPTVTVTVAPKPAPVESTTSATSAPKVVQKKVTVAEPSAETPPSESNPVVTGGAGTSTKIQPGQQPIIVAPVLTPPPTTE